MEEELLETVQPGEAVLSEGTFSRAVTREEAVTEDTGSASISAIKSWISSSGQPRRQAEHRSIPRRIYPR
jgi:hypothetical protein